MYCYDELPDSDDMDLLIDAEINAYYDVLLNKYVDLVDFDEYESIDDSKFEKELMRFTQRIVFDKYHLSREDWNYAVLCVKVEFDKITTQRGHENLFFSHEEAEDYCATWVEENYDTLLQLYLKNSLKRENEVFIHIPEFYGTVRNILYDDFSSRFKYFRSKHLDACFNQVMDILCNTLTERGAERLVKEQVMEVPNSVTTITTGVDFENYIACMLEESGFDVKTTPTTGDQGVDLIAEKNYLSIAIQCKYWQNNVGNSAVQEVFAGSKYYGTTFRAVVSNAGYTSSAKDLAEHLHVYLLHENNLVSTLNDLFQI